ncbi:MAG: GNAT family N-acetyltransferase [Anaerolineae bacterium]|nr:GNAT family N-acetyltransferase [Anaerolineae bacterium]
MLITHLIDTTDRAQVRRFVGLPYRLYQHHPQWVPPIRGDIAMMLNRTEHPFYEHSDADFFIAERDGEVVGRIAALENKPYNDYHQARVAQFYLFECEDDPEIAEALFDRVADWAHQRGLTTLLGPKGFGILDGYGLLVQGYEHRQMMTMMNYNYSYYPTLIEALGFEKEVDFVSCHLDAQKFKMPERIHRIADRVKKRGNLHIKQFSGRKELKTWAERVRSAYNQAFVNNWEFAPMTSREAEFVMKNAISLTDYRLIKVIMHGDIMVGFLFGFPDVSAALQRARGHLTPWALADLLLELRRTKWLALNGAGLVPEFHGVGGNALLYAEMDNTIRDYHFEHVDLTQVAETAVQMRRDLVNVGGEMYKNHRVYRMTL